MRLRGLLLAEAADQQRLCESARGAGAGSVAGHMRRDDGAIDEQHQLPRDVIGVTSSLHDAMRQPITLS